MTTSEQTRRELLSALEQLGQLCPNWRMGQTLANLAMKAGRLDAGAVWDLEDDEALAAALALVERFSRVTAEVEPSATAETVR